MSAHYKSEEMLEFTNKYGAKAILSLPFIKYNHEIIVLGMITLCSDINREWTQDEINFLKTINDSVMTVVWEILKRAELEQLRNTFVLTTGT